MEKTEDKFWMDNLFDYAKSIIRHAPDFHNFAMAIMDYDTDAAPLICKIYQEFYDSADIPSEVKEKMECINVNPKDEERLLDWFYYEYAYYKEEQENWRKKEIKENVDELQHLIRDFRSKIDFKKLLDFVGRSRMLAPYNAMLVEMQKPGSTFVFNGRKWREDFGRQPKPNAQKLITLFPFGPVQVMFDLSDTEPIPGIDKYVEENQLLERWDSLFDQAQGNVGDRMWDNLMFNLPQYGIRYDDSLIASNICGGYLESTQMHDVEITISRDCKIKMRGRYVISVNRNQSRESAFCTICHELGHLFCYHLFYDDSKTVTASPAEKEFEAETVAWIVSKRIGIKNPSEEYLESYSQNGEIPYCSLDHIMKAVTEIEKMLNGRVSIKKSLWYANDKLFRDEVDGIIRSLKHGS